MGYPSSADCLNLSFWSGIDAFARMQVAHRLESIIEYDRVLLMEDGRIIEEGEPRALANQASSVFSSFMHSNKAS